MEKKSREISIPSIEEIKKIMETPGKIKGSAFKGELEYILEKKGEEGLKAVEKKTEKLGYPIKYKEIQETKWYPIGLKMISFYAFLTTFNWGEKELAEIAESSVKVSFIVRFFMRHFLSPEKIFKVAATRLWKRYFSVGSLESADFYNVEKKGAGGYGILRIKNFKLHPFYCLYLGLFFVGIAKLTDPRFKEVNIEETKCMFRGDPYHEYLLKWTYK
jgi:hypothetical protein